MARIIANRYRDFIFNGWRTGFKWYLFKFLCTFLMFYFGTLCVIGLSSKENLYSPIVSQYFDYISPLRQSLLTASKFIVEILGFSATFKDEFTLAIQGGNGVRIVYSCVGYGVLSFWAAFIVANNGTLMRKLKWLAFGFVILWIINVLRVTFLLLADVKNWSIPFGVDHHTLFNLASYGLIFLLIYFFDKQSKLIEVSSTK